MSKTTGNTTTKDVDAKSLEREATRELTNLAADFVPGGNLVVSKLQKTSSGQKIQDFIGDGIGLAVNNIVPITLREGGFMMANQIEKYAEEQLGEQNPNLVKGISIATNAAIVLSEPALMAYHAKEENDKIRANLRAELTDYAQHYGETIKSSVVIPTSQSKNTVLANLEAKTQAQFESFYGDALTSLAIGGAQLAAHQMHNKKMGEVAEEKLSPLMEEYKSSLPEEYKGKIDGQKELLTQLNEAENLSSELTAQIKEITGKAAPKKLPDAIKQVENAIKESEKSYESIKKAHDSLANGGRSAIFDLTNADVAAKDAPKELKDLKLKPYDNRALNTTTGLVFGGAMAGKYAGEAISPEESVANGMVAAELIIHLNKQIRADQITNGDTITTAGLSSEYNLPKTMKLEKFVELIFETHAINQTGEPLPNQFKPKLSQISEEITGALTKPNANHGSEDLLHPLSMIDLVPKIISDDCSCMANIATVHQEIDNAIKTMPSRQQIDTIGYLEKMGSSYSLPPDEMIDYTKQMMRGMDSDTRDLVAYLMPTQVLVNEMRLDEGMVLDARARASEFVLDDVKQIITELNAKSDQELLQDINKAELKTIRSAAKLLDDDSKLQAELSNRDVGGLPFAIVSCESYMQELATGKKITGAVPNNPDVAKNESPSNDNNVEVGDVIDPKSAEVAGKSLNAEKSAAKVAI